ncbi:MAG TPA: hypothetical protein VLH60_03925, partial [Sedimentisphaerales bacterium]|nr:hypothetical protein [Sedimentisphaerales bacterium]
MKISSGQSSLKKPGQRRLVAALAVGLALATTAAHFGIAWNDFISFDDFEYIIDNHHVRQGLSLANVKWAFTSFYAGNWHPLTWLSHMLDVELFGLRPGGHHLANLAIHVASTILLFAFLQWTTKSPWASAFVAALFALHPLRVESVAWASQRKDTLSVFFWMATMLAWAWYAGRPCISRYFAAAAMLALGLMAKPMIVTLPFALLLLDYWPLNRFGPRGLWNTTTLKLIAEKIPLMAMSAGAVLLTLAAQEGAIVSVSTIDVGTRAMNAILSYGRYVWMMFWPVSLGVYYPYPQTPIQYKAAVGLVLLAAVTAVILYVGVRRKYAPVGWFWYLGTLVPVIGLVQVASQSHADRY